MSDPAPLAAGAPRPQAESRLVIALIFLTTLALVSVLLFVHVSETEIAFDASVTAVSFTSARAQAITRPMLVEAMSAAGLTGGDTSLTGPMSGVVHIVARGQGARSGSILLDRIMVPAGTVVSFARTDVPRQYRLSLRAKQPVAVSVHADVMGAVEIRPSRARAGDGDLSAPRPLDLASTTNDLDLDITLPLGATAPRTRQVAATDLRVHQVEEELNAATPEARPMSTIENGSLWFESVGGKERRLRAGELIRLDSARGAIQSITLGADAVELRFQGTVQDIRAGYGDTPRTLMPTLLEALRSREAEKLLWGTALYLFGAVMAVRRWWRKPS